MIAYKGFNKDLVCTMGRKPFRYEIGKSYKENKAQCVETGFHCVEEPIEVLTWYSGNLSRYCIVKAGGDIHEDGNNKISCTEIEIVKEITLEQLAALECLWIADHPERETSRHIERDYGTAKKNGIVIVRGKNPKAAGKPGSSLFLLKEEKDSKNIAEIGAFKIDGTKFRPDVYYKADGRCYRCKKTN